MKKSISRTSASTPETVWTFRELLSQIDESPNNQKLPTAKALRAQAQPLVRYAQNGCLLEVYPTGHFIYTNGKRCTVQSIRRCLSPVRYESRTSDADICVGVEQFLDQPFYIRLALEGEARIAENRQTQEAKKTVSTDHLDMESAYLRDPDSDFVNRLLAEEDRADKRQRLARALSDLTDRQRTTFIQYYAEGKTYQEIADAMGCTKQTVYESVQRALTRVRSFFKEI